MDIMEDMIKQDTIIRYLFSYAGIPKKQRDIYVNVGSKIGKLGWAIASNMPLRIPLLINEENWDERKIDTFFTDFFSGDNCNNITDLISHIQENLRDEYKQSFIEFQKCFNEGLLIPSILTLTSLLEGCCQDLENKESTGMVQLICRRRKKVETKAEIDIPPTLLCNISAIQQCVSRFYKSIDFEEKLSYSNRHMLIHGRCLNNVTKKDCIKLLTCIDSMLHVDFFLSVRPETTTE